MSIFDKMILLTKSATLYMWFEKLNMTIKRVTVYVVESERQPYHLNKIYYVLFIFNVLMLEVIYFLKKRVYKVYLYVYILYYLSI